MSEPTADFWTTQWSMLRQRHPALAQRLQGAPGDSVRIEPTRSGDVTAFIEIGGRAEAIHSRYDPRREAEQFCAAQLQSRSSPCVLVGFGLGYDAEALLDHLSPTAPLLIFEENLDLLRAAFSRRDLRKVLEAPNVLWLVGRAGPEMLEQLFQISESLAPGVQWIVSGAAHRRLGEYVSQAQQLVTDAIEYGRMLRATRIQQGRNELDNLLENLQTYAHAESLESHRGSLQGRPAIVAAAGPSLGRNAKLLTQAAGRVPILAVGAALKPLQRFGVQPDMVVHIDYSELCLRQFQDVGDPGETLLVAGATAAPAPLKAWPGRIAMTQHPYADRLLGKRAPKHTPLRDGTSVAHTAFYIAEYLGASPIILVGLDLAFTDCVYYSAGNALHEQWQPELNRFCTLETKEWERLVRRKAALVRTADWQGRPLFTDKPMANYLRQFERDFQCSPAAIVDATEGGARKNGASRMTLAEVLDQCPPAATTPFFPRTTSSVCSASQLRTQMRSAKDRMLEFARIMQELTDLQRALLKEKTPSEIRERSQAHINRLQLTVTDRLLPEFQMCTTYDPAVEFEKHAQTQRIESQPLAEEERRRAYLERDVAYTEALAEVAGVLLTKLALLAESK